ncbi:HlyD family secretion protein [Novosphingobium sp. Fuku2-ISO-50]|uniref:HlyD family secretion protein n=1 Tax=Novosphingobium sp. Fuku2-ISO-50 TaxID=1739114 RepID=UPI00076DAB04|nr:HlyD family secretion protein [Novosphingobium sp. Fuku2-ISO-50]KUR79883.1 multidrug ABC transporter permease [Novosphingobium sp. Fuku2-ISO-50]
MSAQTDHSPISTPTRENPGRRRLLGRAGIIALVAAGAYGIYAYIGYLDHGQFVQSTDDAYVKADGITVSSKLSGYVRTVKVADNQPVKPGDLLVEVDPTDYRIRLAQASAQEDVARAGQATTRASITEAEAGVAQAQAALTTAQRDLTFYTGEVARYRPLVAAGSEPRQTLDQLSSNRDKAAATVAAQEAALAAAKGKLEAARAQLGQSGAQIEAAAAQADAARTDLATTRLTAPVTGKVASTSVRVGQFVQPGQRLMTIVPVQAIYIEANFKETQIGLMRPGQPVTIEVDALPGVEFHGSVDSITPGTGATFSLIPPQNATGNFTKIVQRVPVRIRIDAGPEARRVLVPGLSLRVDVDTSGARGAIHQISAEEKRSHS